MQSKGTLKKKKFIHDHGGRKSSSPRDKQEAYEINYDRHLEHIKEVKKLEGYDLFT